MYIPSAFQIEDADKLTQFMRQHSFATLITQDATAPFASHLPVLIDSSVGEQGTLLSHMARANPQWRHFASGNEVLTIFQGPHSYISPSWYQTKLAVPTWNYSSVHAYGVPQIIEEQDRVAALLDKLVTTYEAPFAEPWSGDLPAEFRDRLIQGIVAFEIPITRIEGKFKLGQNRSPEDLQRAYAALSQSDNASSRDLARMMAAECLIVPNN